jgi:hypothetical protein
MLGSKPPLDVQDSACDSEHLKTKRCFATSLTPLCRGFTPLHCAVLANAHGTIKLLLSHGAAVDKPNKE